MSLTHHQLVMNSIAVMAVMLSTTGGKESNNSVLNKLVPGQMGLSHHLNSKAACLVIRPAVSPCPALGCTPGLLATCPPMFHSHHLGSFDLLLGCSLACLLAACTTARLCPLSCCEDGCLHCLLISSMHCISFNRHRMPKRVRFILGMCQSRGLLSNVPALLIKLR